MKSILISTTLYGISIYLTWYSSPGNFPSIPIALLIIAVISSLIFSFWFDENSKDRIIKSARIAFPLILISFLLGYFYATIKVFFI